MSRVNGQRAGFTLIELLIVLVVMSILFATARPIYTNLSTSAQLSESNRELKITIEEARARALARRNDSAHGVRFSANDYTLYQGDSYSGRDSSYDRTVELESSITLSENLAGDEINFSRGLGEPSATGTITLTHDVQGATTITIGDLGSVQ